LTDEELVWSYKDLGYDEEHAIKMKDFTIRYNQGADKELTRGQIMTGFKEKIITRADALTLLQDLDYSQAQAEYFIVLEEYKEAKNYQDDIIDNIKTRYQNNFINDFDAKSKLNALNLPATQVNLLMDKWQLKRMIDVKLPSKTDLDKFLLNKIINLDTYRQEMEKLGYNFRYTEWYEKLSAKGKAK